MAFGVLRLSNLFCRVRLSPALLFVQTNAESHSMQAFAA